MAVLQEAELDLDTVSNNINIFYMSVRQFNMFLKFL